MESCSELPQERDSQAEGDDCVKSDDDDDDKLSTESLTSKEKSAAEPEMEKQPLEEVAIDAAAAQEDIEENNSLEQKHEEMENSPEDDPLTEEDRTLEEENHSEKELIMPEVNKADIEGDQEDHHPSQDNKSENSHTQAAEDQEATKDCVVQNHSRRSRQQLSIVGNRNVLNPVDEVYTLHLLDSTHF